MCVCVCVSSQHRFFSFCVHLMSFHYDYERNIGVFQNIIYFQAKGNGSSK